MVRNAAGASKSVKSLKVSNEVFSHVIDYYGRAFEAKRTGSAPIVYHTGFDPVEIDYALGAIPMFPENFSAACGSTQLAPTLMEAAESLNAPQDLCSYFKTHYGFMKGTFPAEVEQSLSRIRLPEPDLVVSTKNLCNLHPIWMQVVAEHYGVPYFSIDAPVIPPRYDQNERAFDGLWGSHYLHRLGSETLEWCVSQLREYIEFLERHTGRRLDPGRLREAVSRSAELNVHFQRLLELRQHVPCPVGGEDASSLVFFPACLAGTEEAVDAFRRAVGEVEERVLAGRGVVPEERYRLIFEGIPPWFNMGLFNYFHRFGAVSVDEFYTRTWCGRLDPDRPLESLAVKYMGTFYATASYQAYREASLERVRLYRADGAILWNLPTCRVMASVQLPRFQACYERDAGIPTLMIDADQVDARRYSAAEVLGKIDAFMAVLETRRAKPGGGGG